MSTNPMHQFNVYRIGPEISLGNVDISFTNASLFMIISAITIISIFFVGTRRKAIVPTKIQLLTELVKITRTKFIIVTHHALTMSKMNRLYGITMPEKGVSQLVAVDLEGAEELVA